MRKIPGLIPEGDKSPSRVTSRRAASIQICQIKYAKLTDVENKGATKISKRTEYENYYTRRPGGGAAYIKALGSNFVQILRTNICGLNTCLRKPIRGRDQCKQIGL